MVMDSVLSILNVLLLVFPQNPVGSYLYELLAVLRDNLVPDSGCCAEQFHIPVRELSSPTLWQRAYHRALALISLRFCCYNQTVIDPRIPFPP